MHPAHAAGQLLLTRLLPLLLGAACCWLLPLHAGRLLGLAGRACTLRGEAHHKLDRQHARDASEPCPSPERQAKRPPEMLNQLQGARPTNQYSLPGALMPAPASCMFCRAIQLLTCQHSLACCCQVCRTGLNRCQHVCHAAGGTFADLGARICHE